VRLIVGVPPGGGFDIVARLMGQWLSERLGQSFVIESRPGAGSNVATEASRSISYRNATRRHRQFAIRFSQNRSVKQCGRLKII
jgi:tripartite-type tricarboxylate transporter receptor subunit TctC